MRRSLEVVVDGATLAAALCAVVLTLVFVREQLGDNRRPDRSVEDWEEYAAVGHRLGARDPTLTIVWWGDYECPFCRRLAPAFKGVLQHHGKEVAVVYRHWPLSGHPAALPGARAALCADAQGVFQPVHELSYEEANWLSDPAALLPAVAVRARVPDLGEFERCLSDDAAADEVIDSDRAAVRGLGATGVPMLMVNDLLLGTVPDSLGLLELVRDRLGR